MRRRRLGLPKQVLGRLTERRGTHLLRTRLALASMRRLALADSFPSWTSLLARALALAACRRSGIGYFLLPGNPKSSLGK